jgi:hypothetical protein
VKPGIVAEIGSILLGRLISTEAAAEICTMAWNAATEKKVMPKDMVLLFDNLKIYPKVKHLPGGFLIGQEIEVLLDGKPIENLSEVDIHIEYNQAVEVTLKLAA